MTEEPGSERWNWLVEGNAKQARKRTAVDIVIRNPDDQVLIVNPTYKEGWDLPGGMVEANESPRAAVIREIKEELALDVEPGLILVVSWIAPHGPWDDLLAITLSAERILPKEADRIVLQDTELSEFKFINPDESSLYLPARLNNRLRLAVDSLGDGRARYIED